MKKMILLVTLLFASVVGATAAPMCTSGATLQSYITLGLGGCFYNDLFLSNFAFTASGSGSAQAITSSAVTVNLIAASNGRGLDFAGNFNLNGLSTTSSATLTYTLTYTVSAPSAYFHGVIASVKNASVDTRSATAPNSAISFTKSLKNGTGCTGTYAACAGSLIQSPSANVSLTDPTNNATAVTAANLSVTKEPFSTGQRYSKIYVNDQLTLTASRNATTLLKGNAHVSDLSNIFLVPEPGTGTMLGGTIGIALILLGKFRRNKR